VAADQLGLMMPFLVRKVMILLKLRAFLLIELAFHIASTHLSSSARASSAVQTFVVETIGSQPRSGMIDFQSAEPDRSFVSIRVEVESAAHQGMGGAQ
jgi:hypothetical protein